MYESITYAELKSLPREQKIEALKELMKLYSSQKKIAEMLGVNPPNIYNMIARYIKEDRDGKQDSKKGRMKRRGAGNVRNRNKMVNTNADGAGSVPGDRIDGNTAVKEEISSEVNVNVNESLAAGSAGSESTPAGTAAAVFDGDGALRNEPFGNGLVEAEDNVSYVIDNFRGKSARDRESYSQNDFLISITKELTGEEAQALLTGIGNIFFRNREYRIDIRITEK